METNDSMATEPPPTPPPPPAAAAAQQLAELIQTLDQAALMAKQLPAAASNPEQHRLIITSLCSAQLCISSYLSLHTHQPDNSVSSAGGGADEPMMMDDDGDGEEEHNSKDWSMERMEEKMRDSLYIQNKRPKRPLSPSSERRRGLEERDSDRIPPEFDPRETRLRNLDLVYQFHG